MCVCAFFCVLSDFDVASKAAATFLFHYRLIVFFQSTIQSIAGHHIALSNVSSNIARWPIEVLHQKNCVQPKTVLPIMSTVKETAVKLSTEHLELQNKVNYDLTEV